MQKDRREPSSFRDDLLLNVLLLMGFGVFLVWAISTLAGTFFNRSVDAQVHTIMLTTVTGLLALSGVVGYRAEKKNGNGKNGS